MTKFVNLKVVCNGLSGFFGLFLHVIQPFFPAAKRNVFQKVSVVVKMLACEEFHAGNLPCRQISDTTGTTIHHLQHKTAQMRGKAARPFGEDLK